jgi:L-aminopeptidase/D-esterase-like protein
VPTEIPGVRVGHWTSAAARTGCTVVLLPEATVASGEVRGGAPATREFALLDPQRLVDRVDAVVLSGGSAFGLAAADGVMRYCEEQGRGFPTPAGRVPIVVGMSLFDLAVGDDAVEVGPVGAGTGATVGTWAGPDAGRPGGLGAATERDGDVVVAALFAVNASGDAAADEGPRIPWWAPFGNTTIGLVVTNVSLTKVECFLVAQSAHDGLARALKPAHTRADGDAVVAAATGASPGRVDAVRELAAAATEAAIRSVLAADGSTDGSN